MTEKTNQSLLETIMTASNLTELEKQAYLLRIRMQNGEPTPYQIIGQRLCITSSEAAELVQSARAKIYRTMCDI